jgi:protoporphyrinogen oxidase
MKTAIIMGAGPAGLTAAYELLTKTDIRPVIIEMDSRVGGLSKTIDYKGNLIDLGGHRFFSKSEKIISWWLQFLPPDKSIPHAEIPITYQNQTSSLKISRSETAGSGSMLLRPRKSRIYYDHTLFDYPLSFNMKTIRRFRIRKLIKIAFSYARAKLFPFRPESNLEQFFINRFGKELYSTFFKGYTEKIWGVPCTEIPADWGHQRIKNLNIGKAVAQSIFSVFKKNTSLTQKGVSTSLIEQFLYPERGPGQMWEAVAEKIRELGGVIHLGARAEKIHVKDGIRITSISYKELDSGQEIELSGDYFFSTIPVKHLVQGLQDTQIPQDVQQIAGNLQYRDFIIVGMLFKKKGSPHKRGVADLKDNWIYLQDQDLTAGRLQIFNNWSPFMVKDEDTVWIGLEYFCRDTDPLWNMTEENMVRLAYTEIKKTGLFPQEEMLDSTVIKVPKAYPSYTGSYNQFPVLQHFLDRFENLYLTGRNGMHRYNNTDHSMMTAMTAVDNIIQNRKSRNNIWAVNMERDFHEEAKRDDG